MSGFYSLSRAAVALNVTDDSLTVLPATGRTVELIEFSIGGVQATATANVVQIARSTGGVTPGGAVTAQPLREAQAAAGFTNATTWGTQPTLGPVLLRIPVSSNGGLYRWVQTEDGNIVFIDGNTNKQLSIRSETGTGTMSFHCIVEGL